MIPSKHMYPQFEHCNYRHSYKIIHKYCNMKWPYTDIDLNQIFNPLLEFDVHSWRLRHNTYFLI